MGSAANRSGGSGDEGPASRVRDSSAPVRLSLILRIWRNPGSEIWGQVVDPVEERRTLFRGQEALFQVLREHMARGGER